MKQEQPPSNFKNGYSLRIQEEIRKVRDLAISRNEDPNEAEARFIKGMKTDELREKMLRETETAMEEALNSDHDDEMEATA